MLKRITALALVLVLALGMLPAADALGREPIPQEPVDQCCHTIRVNTLSTDYVRPDFDGCLYEITPQRVEDHFRYLDEVYVERHPEAALVVNTGDRRDQEVLKTLAETITAGCTTPTEQANAIDRWLHRNIYYDVNTSAYAYDAFYNRTGNCLSYANLMQFLLRSLGIPAVVGDGWRGDMKNSTVDLFNYEGHAWCFVYLEGEWVLYDPLWISCGTTDRDYIAEWIYLDTIEFVTPAYDGDNLPPEAWDKPKIYYTDGRWYNFDNSHPNGYGNYTMLVNNQSYNFTPCQDELALGLDGGYDGWYILDGVNDKSGMQLGEIYCNNWLSYGEYANGTYLNLTYAHPNGMQIDGAIMEYDGVERYMHCNTSFPVLAAEEDYTMQYGCMAFKPGYVGPFVAPGWGSAYDTDYHIVNWESDTPEVCTVDENGILTAVAPGFAQIRLTLTDRDMGSSGYYCITHINVCVSDEVRVPDYTDYAPCNHSYVVNEVVNATCTDWGYEIRTCTLCGERIEVNTDAPLGHNYTAVIVNPTCTEDGYTTYTCTRCGSNHVSDRTEALGHNYASVVTAPTCTEAGYTTFICIGCGDSYISNYTESPGHIYTDWAITISPTCTVSGIQTRFCTQCSHTEQETIAAYGHEYVSVITQPGCDTQGCTTHTCTRCQDSYTDSYVAALGHSWNEGEIISEPTEIVPGICRYTCTVCGETNDRLIPPVAHEHNYESVVTAPTCTTPGFTTYTCDCGDRYTDSYTPALGHDEVLEEGYDATCTEPGLTTASHCGRCDMQIRQHEIIPATGHRNDSVVTRPTCTEQGCTTHTCAVCGESTIDAITPALGHDWQELLCLRCGEVRENPFTDNVPETFYFEPVLWAVEKGITNGTSATTFGSNDQCLRAHVVTFLHRAAQSPAPESQSNPFTDVKTSDFFYAPVLWAVEQGITNGVSADRFGSYDVCNRAAVVTFLWRAAGQPEPEGQGTPFTDVKETDFYYKAVLWAVENGITNGISATEFGPTSACNRAQVVTFLYRAFGE